MSAFQFPLHRDPRCNNAIFAVVPLPMKFQFPLHRDPRCNEVFSTFDEAVDYSFSSLYIGILAATVFPKVFFCCYKCRFSSLYIGILAATVKRSPSPRSAHCFSSLYIGILAATVLSRKHLRPLWVSVPFTSGSSLQPAGAQAKAEAAAGFSSLYIGILAATEKALNLALNKIQFQFPLHRDPRCNKNLLVALGAVCQFQFPLHRDPRCNTAAGGVAYAKNSVSVPFTSGSSLQRRSRSWNRRIGAFQFPLHRDPRCNPFRQGWHGAGYPVSVPFTSGSSLQPAWFEELDQFGSSFSSLYIGILAATPFLHSPLPRCRVSVPFTSGSSLQQSHN